MVPNVERLCVRLLSDNTLNLPGAPLPGPIDVRDLIRLKNEGNVIGICGNYYVALKRWPDALRYISFWGPHYHDNKAAYLGTIKMDIQRTQPHYTDFVMVGNRRNDVLAGRVINGHPVAPTSQDDGWARLAGWRFIAETAFAQGRR